MVNSGLKLAHLVGAIFAKQNATKAEPKLAFVVTVFVSKQKQQRFKRTGEWTMSVKKRIVVGSIFAGLLGIASAAYACIKGGGCCALCGTKAGGTNSTDTKVSGDKTTNVRVLGAQR